MKFVDEALVKTVAGNGGSGFVGWRREKYVPFGGPDGGDGGRGGSVILEADPGFNSLFDFALNPLLRASDGASGGRNQRTGSDGDDAIKKVPVGTQVYHLERLVADLSAPGAKWIAARGGRGGRGNAYFKSSTNQAPVYAQNGEAGEIFEFRLVLKSVADVGLIGLPNVGKSTLISRISAATPKVADYPFTTLQPHLGVVSPENGKPFVVADIPGLIPGAHSGKGLGIKFLKHIERTTVLVHIIDVTTSWEGNSTSATSEEELRDYALAQFELIDRELGSFSEKLLSYPRVIVFSKTDLPESKLAYEITRDVFKERGLKCFSVSSATGAGLKELVFDLYQQVQAGRIDRFKSKAAINQ